MESTRLESQQGQEHFSSPKRPDLLWCPSSLLFNGCRGLMSEIKRLGREFNQLTSVSAEIKNGWSYSSTPHMPSSVHRDNFTSMRLISSRTVIVALQGWRCSGDLLTFHVSLC